MEFEPSIEVVKHNGILRGVYVLDKEGERLADLPLRSVKEVGDAGTMGIVTLELHSLRVKHTEVND